ncbi:MAG: hypothetical protein ACYC4U_16265, partial [Pirellulaceae bacterium]
MGGPEHFVHQRLVAPRVMFPIECLHPFIELQQVFVELGEQLIRLVEKVTEQIVKQVLVGSRRGVAHDSFHS